jgi:hypothetical protein
LIQKHNEKLWYWIWTNFGQNSWNLPTKYRPHHSPHLWMPILCAKKIRGSPSETDSIKSWHLVSIWLNQNSPKNAVIHGGYWGWFHDINQFQTHRHSMKTLPEFISKSRKIRQKSKNVHFFEQKTKNAIPRGPLKGPSMFWAQPTPCGRSQPSDPGEVLSSAVPLA